MLMMIMMTTIFCLGLMVESAIYQVISRVVLIPLQCLDFCVMYMTSPKRTALRRIFDN